LQHSDPRHLIYGVFREIPRRVVSVLADLEITRNCYRAVFVAIILTGPLNVLLNQLGQDKNMNNDENDIKKQIEKIKAFDKWFQYAENIGQQRLYNFLMAASITFVGYATLLTSTNIIAHIIALLLAMLGILMSIIWYVLGKRQAKFHNMLDEKLRDIFRRYETISKEHPIFYVLQMKDHPDEQSETTRLNYIELLLSSRLFLSVVPIVFGVAFFISALISFIYLMLETSPIVNHIYQFLVK
jgi:hypothetical protein